MRCLPFLLLALTACQPTDSTTHPESVSDFASWPHYGGDPGLNHYAAGTRIDTTNVHRLEPVWTYRTGDADTASGSQIQCNPIVVDGVLYGTTPQTKLFAVDAATGEEKWVFDPAGDGMEGMSGVVQHIMINSRGLTHWRGNGGLRLFYTAGSYTYAVDAQTGRPVPDFGTEGRIDLHAGLGRRVDDNFVVATSPGVVFEDLLIMGTRVDETLPAAPGHIRAYDVRSGEQRWIFRTIPEPGDAGYDSWDNPDAWRVAGGANPWSGFSLDPARGVVYCGTGSASYDFYGANRPGTNLFANCILALDARTGERKWHYQTVHHDLWDRDHPTPPVLVTVDHGGGPVDAVAQPTKSGDLFLLHRDTGEPLFPVEEVPVPTEGALPGEVPHPTQPRPTLPRPFARTTLDETSINPYLTERDRDSVRRVYATSDHGVAYRPPSLKPQILFPGYDGGAEWGGPAFDPTTGLLYVNANNMAWVMKMDSVDATPPGPETIAAAGQRLYGRYCRSCHGADRAGTGNNPSLLALGSRYDDASLGDLLRSGRRMMPAFPHLKAEQLDAIAAFVLERPGADGAPYPLPPPDPRTDPGFVPYRLAGYNKFLAPDGKPAIAPPWGTLTAVDLNTGEHRWQVPLGEYPDYRQRGIPPTGTENYGGPVVTAGGLVFIAATVDEKMRAFHARTGELLWEAELPAAGFATPAVYSLGGRQYVVIACGGGKLGTRAGDAYLAFGLPD